MKIADAILICILITTKFFAQMPEVRQVQIGDRVRVTTSKPTYVHAYGKTEQTNTIIIGTLTTINADTIFVLAEDEKDAHEILRSDILKLETSTGKKSKAVTYAVRGLLGGALIGGFIGFVSYSDTGSEGIFSSRGQSTLAGATLFGATGLLIGTIGGSLTSKDKWVEATI